MCQSTNASPCSCCRVSRRCFLAGAAAALSAPFILGRGDASYAQDTLGEYIDLASFRPKPKVTVLSVVAREKPPYWLGWPGTAYDLEGHRTRFCQAFAEEAKGVGVDLVQIETPLEDDAAVAQFAQRVSAEKPDAVLVMLQHLGSWGKADVITKAGVPTIIFAPIGMAFTGHVLEISRRPGVHVISSLETSAVGQALRMVRAKRQLEESRLLVVAGEERKDEVLEGLGTKIRRVPRNSLHELFSRMPETDETHAAAELMMSHAERVVEPTKQDALNAARSYMTAKRLLRDEDSNAITSDCLGMVTMKEVPTPPCMAATMFQDAGITYGCEADLNAALSLMFVSYLFDKPGFMNDPVPETFKNLLITAHCTSGTRLNGFDAPAESYMLRSHSESNIGVSTQVIWKPDQPVTLVSFQNPHALILDSGTVVSNVDTPPAGGCRTNFEIAMDRIEDVRDVMGFHQVVFYGDHRRDVEAYCQMYGIKVVNSPEHAPDPATA